jgi:hypothetical protein
MREDCTLEELREFCTERGIKFDKRFKEKSLIKLLDEYEKNNSNSKEDVGEQVKAEPVKEDEPKPKEIVLMGFENSVVYSKVGEESIKIYNVRGGGFIREYSLDVHGERWLELAEEFIRGRLLKK